MALEFEVPWLWPSLKNNVVASLGYRGGRAVPELKKHHRVVRAQHALEMVTRASLLRGAGAISRSDYLACLELAVERLTGNGRVGEKTLQRAIDQLPQFAPLYKDDVSVEIDVVVGDQVADDFVRVRVEDLGPCGRKRNVPQHKDIANVPALLLDAMQESAYRDDRQVVDLRTRRVFKGDA